MIVFDLFIDIESTYEFQIYFFQIFKILSENHVPVMIEVPVSVNTTCNGFKTDFTTSPTTTVLPSTES